MGLLGDYGSGSEDSSDNSDQEVPTKGREIFESWVESKVVSFFIFWYIQMMDYFRLDKTRVKLKGLEPPAGAIKIGEKLLWKYEETRNFGFYP